MNRVLLYQHELYPDTEGFFVFSFEKQDERYRHIKKVLRLTEGDRFKAGVINGKKGTADIIAFSPSRLTARFTGKEESQALYPIRLLLGFPRPIQLRRILRDVAGLGIETLCLTGTDLGEKSYLQADIAEPFMMERLLADGCAQAGETLLPAVHKTASLQAFFSQELYTGTCNPLKAVLDVPFQESGSAFLQNKKLPPQTTLSHLPWNGKRTLWLAAGNERGWSAAERNLFAQHGFSNYTMGSRIFRTETAVTAALSVCLSQAGCWDTLPHKGYAQ